MKEHKMLRILFWILSLLVGGGLYSLLINETRLGALPISLLFLLFFVVVGFVDRKLRHGSNSEGHILELSVFRKKIIASIVIWWMCSFAWVLIVAGERIKDVFDEEYLLLYLLPAAIILIAPNLWKWANRPVDDFNVSTPE